MNETLEMYGQETSGITGDATSLPGLEGGTTLSGSQAGPKTAKSGPAPVRVSRSVQQEKERVETMNDISGQLGLNLSKLADLPSFSENRSLVPMAENGSRELRICNVCLIEKSLSEFYRHKESLKAYRASCKSCCRKTEHDRKSAIPTETRKAEFRKWRKTNRAKALMTLARFRAKQKGLPFALDENAIQGVIDAGVCELTRIPFNLDGGKTWDSPSLDRIDSSKGYTPDNVRVVLYCINVMANVWGENKIIEIADAIMAMRRSRSTGLQTRLESSLKRRLNIQSSPEYALTWKPLDMPSGPPICALRASGRRTSGNGSTGWPSPKAQEDGRTLEQYEEGRLRGYRTRQGKISGGPSSKQGGLSIAVQLTGWPTPQTHDVTTRGNTEADHHHFPHDLSNAALMVGWSTPRATDGSNGGPNQAGGALSHDASLVRELSEVRTEPNPIMRMPGPVGGGGGIPHQTVVEETLSGWATPTTRDHKDTGNLENVPVNCLLGRQVSLSSAETAKLGGYRLNPAFSLWLQGFPVDEWESCAPQGMPSSRK